MLVRNSLQLFATCLSPEVQHLVIKGVQPTVNYFISAVKS